MAVVPKPGRSLFARVRAVVVAPLAPIVFSHAKPAKRGGLCPDGEHRWELVDRFGVPPLWKCTSKGCEVYGFVRRKGHGFRNGRPVIYTCSTRTCSEPAKIRSRYRGAGGAWEWACCDEHAKGEKFKR